MATGYNTVTVNWLNSHLASPEEVRMYARDVSMLAATDEVIRAMEQRGLSKAQLAERIGWSRSMVSQTLSGSRNMTLKTLADMLWACGLELRALYTRALGESTVPIQQVNHWLDEEGSLRAVSAADDLATSASKELRLEVDADDPSQVEAVA